MTAGLAARAIVLRARTACTAFGSGRLAAGAGRTGPDATFFDKDAFAAEARREGAGAAGFFVGMGLI